jgi:hypothetical protein
LKIVVEELREDEALSPADAQRRSETRWCEASWFPWLSVDGLDWR